MKRTVLIGFAVGCGLVVLACTPTAAFIAWHETERWLTNRGKN